MCLGIGEAEKAICGEAARWIAFVLGVGGALAAALVTHAGWRPARLTALATKAVMAHFQRTYADANCTRL